MSYSLFDINGNYLREEDSYAVAIAHCRTNVALENARIKRGDKEALQKNESSVEIKTGGQDEKIPNHA